MKKFLRGIVTGSLITLLVMNSTLVFGESTKKNITVFFNDIKICSNGIEINGANTNGSKVEPFIYNGNTYLPVRIVGEAIGRKVTWDPNTYTVYLEGAKRETIGISTLDDNNVGY